MFKKMPEVREVRDEVTFTVKIPVDIHTKLKALALIRKTPMKTIVLDYIENSLDGLPEPMRKDLQKFC